MTENLPAPVDDDPPTRDVAIRSHSDMTSLELFAIAASQAHRLAQSLAKTNFVPTSMKGKPDDVAAAILAGQELGLQPMATLRSIDIIQGVPSLRALTIRAILQSHGHDIEPVGEPTAEKCVMRGRRKGAEKWITVTWDIARAKLLGLTGKDQWQKQPQTMLIARATAELGRLVAADLLLAMPYAAEEIDEPYQAGQAAVGAPLTAADILGAPVVVSTSDVVPELASAEPAAEPAAEPVKAADPSPTTEEPAPARQRRTRTDAVQVAFDPEVTATREDPWADVEVRKPGQDA